MPYKEEGEAVPSRRRDSVLYQQENVGISGVPEFTCHMGWVPDFVGNVGLKVEAMKQ